MKRSLTWVAGNTAFAVVAYYGFVEGVGGARNVATFYVWFGFVLSLLTFSDSVRAAMQAKGPPVPVWLDGLFDTAVAGFLMWNGEMLLASIYVIHTLLLHAMYAKPEPTA